MKMWQICADVTCSKLTLGLEQTDRKNTRPEPRFSVCRQIFEKVFQTASSQSPKKWGNIKNKRKKRIIAKMRKNENFLEEYPVDIIHLCRQTVRQWGRISQEMQFIDLYPINLLTSSEMKNLMYPWCLSSVPRSLQYQYQSTKSGSAFCKDLGI